MDPRTFPVERIAALVHALPPPGTPVDVADLPGGAEAAAWLNAHARPARLVPAPAEPRTTRIWEPSPALSEWIASPLKGRVGKKALDLGCGTGRDAVFLALRGWRVTAVDRLPDALDRARLLADLHGVDLDLRELDVERSPLPLGARQGGGAGGGGYDLVTAFRYLPSLAKMASALAPGGSLLVETFTDRERERTGKPRDPALVLLAAAPPPLPPGMVLENYAVREVGGRELAALWAVRSV